MPKTSSQKPARSMTYQSHVDKYFIKKLALPKMPFYIYTLYLCTHSIPLKLPLVDFFHHSLIKME